MFRLIETSNCLIVLVRSCCQRFEIELWKDKLNFEVVNPASTNNLHDLFVKRSIVPSVGTIWIGFYDNKISSRWPSRFSTLQLRSNIFFLPILSVYANWTRCKRVERIMNVSEYISDKWTNSSRIRNWIYSIMTLNSLENHNSFNASSLVQMANCYLHTWHEWIFYSKNIDFKTVFSFLEFH